MITDAAFAKGLHVLCEKPVAVRVGMRGKTNELHKRHPTSKYGLMFQTRTNPLLPEDQANRSTRGIWGRSRGSPGSRPTGFATWTYFASGGWRGTWAGEGGGVLINQNPHNLDLLQWLPGMMPQRITAIASPGQASPDRGGGRGFGDPRIPDGAIGHFVTGTGEYPGTDRWRSPAIGGGWCAREGR